MAFRLASFYGAVFLFVGFGMPWWPVWLSSRGVTAAEIGVLMSLATWVRALAPPFIAQAADRRGERKRVIVLLCAVTLGGHLLFLPAHGFWPILGVMMLTMLAFGAVIPLGENVAMLCAREQGLDYGRLRLWGSLSFILAATFGGRFLEGRGADVILYLVLASLALCVASASALPDVRPPPARSGRRPIAGLLSIPVFLLFALTVGTVQAGHAVYYSFATLHWRAAGIADGVIGALWAEGVIVEVALFAVSGWAVRLVGPVRLIMLGALAGIVRWTVLGETEWVPALVAVQGLHALTFAATHLGTMHFLARAVPPEWSATAQSLYTAIAGIAMGLAMLGSGFLYESVGGAAFYAMAALSALGLLGALALARVWKGGAVTPAI